MVKLGPVITNDMCSRERFILLMSFLKEHSDILNNKYATLWDAGYLEQQITYYLVGENFDDTEFDINDLYEVVIEDVLLEFLEGMDLPFTKTQDLSEADSNVSLGVFLDKGALSDALQHNRVKECVDAYCYERPSLDEVAKERCRKHMSEGYSYTMFTFDTGKKQLVDNKTCKVLWQS